MSKSSKSTELSNHLNQYDYLLQGWQLYFDPSVERLEKFHPQNNIHMMIKIFNQYFSGSDFFKKLFKWPNTNLPYLEPIFDYTCIQTIADSKDKNQQMKTFVELMNFFPEKPQLLVSSISLALHHSKQFKQMKKNKLYLSIVNYPLIALIDIKAHMVNNFISTKVIILKVNHIKLLAVSMKFKCIDCKNDFKYYFSNGFYTIPQKCLAKNKKLCYGKNFIPDKFSFSTIFHQKIKVQEIDAQGRVPKIIEVEFRQNLVGKVISGDTIIVSGYLKTETSQERDKKTQGIFTPLILANSIINERVYKPTEFDDQAIKKIKKNKYLFISLIKSFCPTIYGHELVKAGLLLGLIGGSAKQLNNKTNFRQSSHILLLGDPGLGKSQMLKFASSLLPHSMYVSGNSISHSGLTVTLNKQSGNDCSLQAGALVLSDGGVCAIDQFDKITDSTALLEVMQQQTISVAKSGIICQLQSRVSIIASANPINGNYLKTKSLKDNIKISNAILSRFDLIFLMLDNPDPERDKKLSEHIMRIHNKNRKKTFEEFYAEERKNVENNDQFEFRSLMEKYSTMCRSIEQVYTIEQLKIYLNYVKNEVHPILSPEAADIIKSFFITLRQQNLSSSFPITTRQLESLVRLSMARARLEMRTEVTKEDAEEITQFMQESLFDALEDMSSGINSLRNQLGKKHKYKPVNEMSIPKQTKLFIQKLNQVSEEKNSSIFEFSELIKIGKQLGLSVGDFDDYLQKLNNEGHFLQKGGKRYQLKSRML